MEALLHGWGATISELAADLICHDLFPLVLPCQWLTPECIKIIYNDIHCDSFWESLRFGVFVPIPALLNDACTSIVPLEVLNVFDCIMYVYNYNIIS